MAAKDFANIDVPQVEVEKPLTHVKTMLLTALSVLLVLGTFMGGFWLGKKKGIEAASGEGKAKLQQLLKEQQDEMKLLRQEAAKQKVQPEVSTTQVGDLTFYNELPGQSVKPAALHAPDASGKRSSIHTSQPKVSASASTRKMREMIEQEMRQLPKKNVKVVAPKQSSHSVSMGHSKAQKQGFVLQVGSFQKQADANAFLPKLTKRGFSPMIRRVELPSLGVWYRVYVTGYASRSAAGKAKETMKKSLNITALILKAG